jgi:hypothetical protein
MNDSLLGPWFMDPQMNEPPYPKPQDSRPAPDDVPPGD